MSHPPDRASRVTPTILAIIGEALRAWFRGDPVAWPDVREQVENLLRDEFADERRER